MAEREGPFAKCAFVVHFDEPACTVRWFALPVRARAVAVTAPTTPILRPETHDRKVLATFLETLAESLVKAASPQA